MSKVKKAIFVVAGFGTRLLPQSKAVPKEMIPVVDKPIIQYLVEEASNAGIEEIIFVTGRGKSAIENHFDKSYELELKLEKKGKLGMLEEMKQISNACNYAYVRQEEQNGDGHALLHAKPFVDLPEPVLVVFPDYIMPQGNRTLKKMLDYYDEHQKPIIATDRVPMEDVPKFGVLGYEETDQKGIVKIKEFVEKPAVEDAPSNLINNGYAVITSEIWDLIAKSNSTYKDGEIRVADAFVNYIKDGGELYALEPVDHGYDCGSKLGYLKAVVDFALKRDDLKEDFARFLKNRAGEI